MSHTHDGGSGPGDPPMHSFDPGDGADDEAWPATDEADEADEPATDLGWPDEADTTAATEAGTSRWAGGTWEPAGDDALVLAALMSRVLLQDAAALSTMYQLLSSAVYAQVLRLTRQVPLAEELLADVFWQVWRQAPRFDARRGPVRAWVMMMARSRALDALRRQRRNPLVVMNELPARAELAAAQAADDPQALLAATQAGGALHAALLRLDPLRRQLVTLTYFRGLTQQEVADHTGLPLGTVKSHLRRALAALRETLGPADAALPAAEAATP